MAAGSGIASQIVWKPETVYGVVPYPFTGFQSIEFMNETLELSKTTVQGSGLHAGGLYNRSKRRVVTNYDAGGAITMDLQTRSLNTMLFQMFGSYGQANATLTQDGVTGAYKAIHYQGDYTGHSMCVQKGVPAIDGTVKPFTYVGGKITDWEISVATGALAQLVLTFDFRNELGGAGNSDPLNGSVPALVTWANVSQGVFHFRQANLLTGTPTTSANVTSLTGATTLANIKSASVKNSVSYDNSRYFLGGGGFKAEPLQNGLSQISGTFVGEWLSNASYYNTFAADTALAIELKFVGNSIGSGSDFETLDILIPNVKLLLGVRVM